MSNNTKVMLAFIFGTIVGAVAAYRYAVKTMDCEMIYAETCESEETEDEIETITDSKRTAAEQAKNKRDITEYASMIHKESYIPEESDDPEDVETVDAPYVISPKEFGECNYETISLTYYSDGVLVDENNDPVDDVNEIVGKDFASHFREYEEDSIFIRNDSKKCDYEILRDYKNYYAP